MKNVLFRLTHREQEFTFYDDNTYSTESIAKHHESGGYSYYKWGNNKFLYRHKTMSAFVEDKSMSKVFTEQMNSLAESALLDQDPGKQ